MLVWARRSLRLSLGRLGVRLVPVVLAACYTYTPLATVAPTPGLRVSLALTDQGRVGVAPVMGAGLDRIEGTLVRVTDSSYVVQVASVTDVRGAVTKWVGETVTIERAWVANASERRFSRSRTYFAAGGFTAAVAAFIASRGLFGRGGPILWGSGGGDGGNNQ